MRRSGGPDPPPPRGEFKLPQFTLNYRKSPSNSLGNLKHSSPPLPPPPGKKFLDPCMNYQQHSAERSFKIPQSMKINLPL